ncbi:MAG TPA: DUF3108 domain-containing protein [Kofleriaceae bacterium]|nr:DUF3108 domain-containing protein [Kofleriaceae bacterium]
MRVLALSLVLCACGTHHPSASVPHEAPVLATKLPEGPPLVAPGERMSYELALGGMELATYDLAVGDITDVAGKKAIVVQSHAKAVGLVKVVANIDDVFTSWIDVSTGRPLLWSVDEYATKSQDKERTEARLAERSGDIVPITFHLNDEPPTPEPQKVSMTDVWDYNAFLVAVRAWDAPPRSTVSAEVLRSRFLWHVDLTIHGKETLHTALGDLPALRIDGHTYKLTRQGTKFPDSDERDFSLWISDDDGRVPLQNVARTDYGDIKMTITEYVPGTGKRLRP